MIDSHIVTLRGGPADGQQLKVPIKSLQIVVAENRMNDMPAMSSETVVQGEVVKHVYSAATVVQGHTIVYEFFYVGILKE